MLLRELVPAFVLCHFGFGLRQVGATRWCKGEIFLSGFGRQLPPDPIRFHHDRELRPVPALLTHPTPVAARLLACHPAFFAQQNLQPALREKIGRRCSDDSCADDNDIDRFRKTVGKGDGRGFRDHRH